MQETGLHGGLEYFRAHEVSYRIWSVSAIKATVVRLKIVWPCGLMDKALASGTSHRESQRLWVQVPPRSIFCNYCNFKSYYYTVFNGITPRSITPILHLSNYNRVLHLSVIYNRVLHLTCWVLVFRQNSSFIFSAGLP